MHFRYAEIEGRGYLAKKVVGVVMAFVLAIGLMPLPAYAGSELVAANPATESSVVGGAADSAPSGGIQVAASSPSVDLVPSGSSDNRRYNKSWPTTAAGSSETLTASISNQGSKKVKNYSWTQTNSAVASLSSTNGKSTTVTATGAEGYTVVTAKVTFTDGSSCSESAAYCVYSPLPSLDAHMAESAKLARGADPESDTRWLRGTAPAGQECEVVGACGSKYRVEMPDDFEFTEKDKIPTRLAYVDKAKVHVEVDSVAISGAPDEPMEPGAAVQLVAEISPDIASDKRVNWESTDPNVAAVDASGRVTAIGVGLAEVSATAVDGGESDSVEIEVAVPGIEVSLDKEGPLKLGVGDSLRFAAAVTADVPLDDYGVTWSSSDPSVASIDASGKVTGMARGTTVIRASSSYGASASVTVVVMASDDEGMSLEEFLKQFPALGDGGQAASPNTGSAKGSGNKGSKAYINRIFLSWKKVKGAKKYEVQVKYGKKWREINDFNWVKAPKHSCTVTAFFGFNDDLIRIGPDSTYQFRVFAYKKCFVKSKRGKKTRKKYVKMKKVRKITVTTPEGDPSDLLLDYYRYLFRNETTSFTGHYDMDDVSRNKLIDVAVNRFGYDKLDAEDSVNRAMNRKWDGSCFGMSTTTLLNGYKRLDVCGRVGEGYKWQIGIIKTAPKGNRLLLSLINYFQCAFFLLNLPDLSADEVAALLVDDATGRTRAAGLRVFDFYWPVLGENGNTRTAGHAILVHKQTGGVPSEQVTSGVHKGCARWRFRTYDPNAPAVKTYLNLYRDAAGNYSLEVGDPSRAALEGNYPVPDGRFELTGDLDALSRVDE